MLLRCLLLWRCCPGRRRQRRLYPHRPDADPAELSGGCAERAHCDVLAGSARQSLGFLRSLLAGIDGDGRVQMAMNGGIYDKAYAPLGLYIEDGKRLTPVNRSPAAELLYPPRRRIPGGKRPGENRAAAGVQTLSRHPLCGAVRPDAD